MLAPPPPRHLAGPPAPPPAFAHQNPHGTRVRVGLGHSTVLADMDFEVFSAAGFVWNPARNKWDGPPRSVQNKKGLGVVGAKVYAEHPSTEVLCIAYDLKDGHGWRHWRPGKPLPFDLFMYLARGGLIEAHNSGFERLIWRHVCERLYGFPPVDDGQWRCSMAKARAASFPGALGNLSSVMNLPIKKDADGDRLIKKFCYPRDPTKADPRTRILPVDIEDPALLNHPDRDDTLKLYNYNATDIQAEAEVSIRVPDLENDELELWQEDQQINTRGVKIDRAGLLNCIAVIEQCHEQYNAELFALTGIDSASKLEQLKGWLAGRGVFMDVMDEDAIDEALKSMPMPPEARRVLEIRGAIGSAAVKKVFSMRNRLDSRDRLCDLFIYGGAHTLRFTGDGPQPTNMPSGGPKVYRCAPNNVRDGHAHEPCGRYFGTHAHACPWCGIPVPPDRRKREWCPGAAEDALTVMALQDMRTVEHYFGDAMHAVSGCIRALYIAEDDSDLVSSDYSSIEAVGLAMIAGEPWRIDVFRTHGRIYETSASRMFKVPFDEMMAVGGWTVAELARPEWWTHDPATATGQHHPLRKTGKVAELALGYGGWVGACKAFEMPGTDDEMKANILAWRAASPNVEWLWGGQTRGKADGVRFNMRLQTRGPLKWNGEPDRWDDTPEYFGCEGMAVQAILYPGTEFRVLRQDGSDTGVIYLVDPSIDVLYCTLPSGRHMHYNRPRLSPSDRGGLAISFEKWNTNPKNGPKGWITVSTFGGRLVENIVQATCRDILKFAILNLRKAGYPTVLHIYDEIVAEVKKWFGTLIEFETIMAWVPEWAKAWPVKAAGGWRGRRYRKG